MPMRSTTKGMLWILASALGFATMSAFVRLSGDIPFYQKAFFRNLVAVIAALPAFLKAKKPQPSIPWGLLLLRSSLGIVGLLCNFYAIDRLALSDASMLNNLSPFFTIVFSFLFLKEKVSLRQVLLVILAFMGALLIIQPSMDFSQRLLACLVGLLGGMGAGSAYAVVRALGKRGVPAALIVLFFSVFSTLILLPFQLIHRMEASWIQILWLLLAGLAATMGQIGVTRAYSYAPASRISIFSYANVAFSAVYGLVLFSQRPDGMSLLGYFVIMLSAILMFLYNRGHEDGRG